MNRLRACTSILLGLAYLSAAVPTYSQGKTTPSGEDFFIVASVDQPKSQVLVKHPTEVTTLLNVNAKTVIVDDKGKSIHVSDLRAGDTLWVVSSGQGQDTTAIRIRKGSMSIADLHRYYLDYPEIK